MTDPLGGSLISMCAGLSATRSQRCPIIAVELPGPGRTRRGRGDRRVGVDLHDPALAGQGRDQTLATPVLDLHQRPELRRRGHPGPGPAPPSLGRETVVSKRTCHLRRRRDLHPSRLPVSPLFASGQGPEACVSATTTTAAALAHLATDDVHRAKIHGRCDATTGIEPINRAGQTGQDPGAVRIPRPRVLGRRQRIVTPGAEGHRPPRREVPRRSHDAHTGPRVLADTKKPNPRRRPVGGSLIPDDLTNLTT